MNKTHWIPVPVYTRVWPSLHNWHLICFLRSGSGWPETCVWSNQYSKKSIPDSKCIQNRWRHTTYLTKYKYSVVAIHILFILLKYQQKNKINEYNNPGVSFLRCKKKKSLKNNSRSAWNPRFVGKYNCSIRAETVVVCLFYGGDEPLFAQIRKQENSTFPHFPSRRFK